MPNDYRIGLAKLENLSYSNMLTLHLCPRRFELEKRSVTPEIQARLLTIGDEPAGTAHADFETNTDFLYGHSLAAGIQDYIVKQDRNSAIWESFIAWNGDLDNVKEKSKKSIWHVMFALDNFIANMPELIGDSWEVAQFDGKPAVELTFKLQIGNGYQYFGHIDLVLFNPQRNEFLVLELKTSSFNNVDEAVYKNSAQALGYSLMLDKFANDLDSVARYEVLYLVYQTGQQQYVSMPFTKTRVQRAQWIKQLLLDCEIINLYAEHDLFPMHGESCYSYFRRCEFYDVCQMGNRAFPKLYQGNDVVPEEHVDAKFIVQLSDLVELQLGASSFDEDAMALLGEVTDGNVEGAL